MIQDRYLSRGKRIDTGEWITGYCVPSFDYGVNIKVYNDFGFFEYEKEIIEETLGQCTGVRDKNGTLIFEGDIVKGREKYEISDVVCRDSVWTLSMWFGHSLALWTLLPLEVIGNKWDNPEILEDEVEKDSVI